MSAQEDNGIHESASVPTPDDVTLEQLEAALPAHLRTPLPVKNFTPPQTPPALAASAPAQPASRMETFFRAASGVQNLTQFGYDFLRGSDAQKQPPSGTVQDDYVLGAGDRITISFMGERKDHKVYTIDRNGTLAVDLLPPLAASGKSLGALRADLKKALDAQAYHGDLYIALEGIRQIDVLVAGQVEKPGRQTLTPLQSVLEALEAAGGVQKNGSLRQIRLVREGQTTQIDLYDVITGAQNYGGLPALREGDRIIVPTLGPTAAITGDVRAPAIYELPADKPLDAAGLLAMAGGPLARGQNRMTLMTPQADGRRAAQATNAEDASPVRDGAILNVARTDDLASGSFTLAGAARNAGTYPLASYPALSSLLRRAQAYGDDVYPLLGVIRRRAKNDLSYDMIAFSPRDIFTGAADVKLHDGDAVTLFRYADIRAATDDSDATTASANDPLMDGFIREHTVMLQGAVRMAGAWPVAGTIAVTKLLDAAGGIARDGDGEHVEINRNDDGTGDYPRRDVVDLTGAQAGDVVVRNGDAVRVPDRFEVVTRASVTLRGEVRNPGTYDLMRGDTLMDLIDRAGGLTDEAYPMGTVFSRASERRREKERYAMAAHDLERAIATATHDGDGRVNAEQIALTKDLVSELKAMEPVGRITVEADPDILDRDPAQDILLESGDSIYIPRRPLNVRVTGEVLSPAALQFRADKSIRDYVAEAGGTTRNADTSRMFVLNPDGSAQPVSGSSWTRVKALMIVPGSTIVVPRDPKPFDFIESAKDITQILSNIALTGIYGEDIVDRTK